MERRAPAHVGQRALPGRQVNLEARGWLRAGGAATTRPAAAPAADPAASQPGQMGRQVGDGAAPRHPGSGRGHPPVRGRPAMVATITSAAGREVEEAVLGRARDTRAG